MTKETKKLISKLQVIIEDIFDNYDDKVYSKEHMKDVHDWLKLTEELNLKLDVYDEPKKTKNDRISFLDALKKWFGLN